MDIYKKLDFPQRAEIFETFLPENTQFPKTNTPYEASIVPKMTQQIISVVSCLLGYYYDQWVDEVLIGFLSIFLVDEKPSLIFNEFLVELIHEALYRRKFQICLCFSIFVHVL